MTQFGVRRKSKAEGKPSEAGFGPVPDQVRVLGYVCERIAARASLSLSLLRNMRYGDDPDGEKARAAAVALLVLGMAGDALARHDTHLRSGSDLAPIASRWGLRRSGSVTPEPVTVEQPHDPEWWSDRLSEAMQQCHAVGLDFAAPVELALSEPQRAVLADAAARQVETQEGA